MTINNSSPDSKEKVGLSVRRLNRILKIIFSHATEITVESRELPYMWSLEHMFTTMQLAKLLALKRNLNPELAAITCALHDCYTLFTGKTEDHGVRAEPYIREIIAEYNTTKKDSLSEITAEEVGQIIKAVSIHSDKTIITNDPLSELLKDIDSLDSYLHGITQEIPSGRILRVNRLFEELHIAHIVKE